MFVLVFALVGLCTASHEDLSSRYRFQWMLDSGDQYMLHWSFDLEAGTIEFAVNVSTTGWVGFGLSPNGQMPLSDVVIGWVDDQGKAQFHDRFAKGRSEPEIDASQDWFLVAHIEKDGRTILEFARALVTCDDEHDLAITTDTARIVWSYGANDPAGITGLAQHTNQGSASINLLGGLNEDRLNSGSEEMYFDALNENVEIPSDLATTYWCQVVMLPAHITTSNSEHFVYKTSPVITTHDRQFVHHLVVFLCPQIISHNFSGNCKDSPPADITLCTNTRALGSWAVGGGDFIYPNDVAFPIGTANNEQYVVLEVHYDNPDLTPGIVDSSGMRFYYTPTAPTHKAGIMTMGHHITKLMVIPPTTEGYTTSGICSPSCTNAHFPSDGITVFGNIFHTHLIGASLKLRHYTRNDTDCDGWKEMEPIDQNLHYDFNYQQYNILSQTRKVMPGDAMDLECVYKSSRTGVTLGGLSTIEEMCLSFIVYYPKLNLSICASRPSLPSFQNFTDKYYPSANKSLEVIEHLANEKEEIKEDFDSIDWTPAALGDLESAVRTGNLTNLCVINISSPDFFTISPEEVPIVQCPYQPPPMKCQAKIPLPTRITHTVNPYGVAGSKSTSASLLATLALLVLATKII